MNSTSTIKQEIILDKNAVMHWIDDDIADIIDGMEGFAHHTFQVWLEFVKTNQPRDKNLQ